MNVIHDDILGILIFDALGALFELLRVLGRPPVLQVPVSIELAAFIVESVREFMANRATGVAVVGRVVQFGVVKRRLQHARGKVDVVHLRIVVGIDRGRRDVPLSVIDGLSNLVELPPRLKYDRVADIAREIGWSDFHRAVIAPMVGIADFVADGMQLDDRLALGPGAHPVKLIDAQLHSFLDFLNHLERARLQFG